jgi:hypothetical protein
VPRPSARVQHVTPGVRKLVRVKSMMKKVVEEVERRELSDGKAEKCGPCRGTRRIRIRESGFMLQQ